MTAPHEEPLAARIVALLQEQPRSAAELIAALYGVQWVGPKDRMSKSACNRLYFQISTMRASGVRIVRVGNKYALEAAA